MRVFYPEYIPDPKEAAEIRGRLGCMAGFWSGVCVSAVPIEDRRRWWQRWISLWVITR
jgi:hypothetical protein